MIGMTNANVKSDLLLPTTSTIDAIVTATGTAERATAIEAEAVMVMNDTIGWDDNDR